MTLSMERMESGINWSALQRRIKMFGIAAGFFGLGVWADGIHAGTAKLPWLHQQAATLHVVQTQVVPALKAEAGCEHWRAATTTQLALQPVTVSPSQIPLDCPHPAVK